MDCECGPGLGGPLPPPGGSGPAREAGGGILVPGCECARGTVPPNSWQPGISRGEDQPPATTRAQLTTGIRREEVGALAGGWFGPSFLETQRAAAAAGSKEPRRSVL